MDATEVELTGLVEGCLEAIEEEIAAVRADLERRGLAEPIAASGGRLASASGPGLRYDFTIPPPLPEVRPDDGVRLRSEAGESFGFVSWFDRRSGRVGIAVQEWLGPTPGDVELEFDPSWLLVALSGRLEALLEEPDRYAPETVLRLLGRRYPSLGSETAGRTSSEELNEAQREALERMLGSDTHFVWGPPGTGKTRLLGHAVAELAETGTVLVACTTNSAVDEAAARTASALGQPAILSNRVIRLGAEYGRTGDPRLSLGAALERRIAGGAGRIADTLEEIEKRLDARGGSRGDSREDVRARHLRLSTLARARGDSESQRELSRLGGEIQKQAILALRKADVVLTTLARLAVREELASMRFDAMIIDEASSAPLPYVVLAASMTRNRAYAIGDFQQLPAVVASDGEASRRWMRRDVFREAGVVRDAPPGELALPAPGDRLCAMLVEQYRMAPQVRLLVSELFYGGRLVDAPEISDRPGPPDPLLLLETSGLDPVVVREEGSRWNDRHATSILEFLQEAARAGVDDVAVVVPYRLQARRLWSLVRGRLGRAAPTRLEISTVHRFQGREKSVVVFDTVDAPPARSWFLHEGRNPDLPRLLNVALSRTRDMLVVVATREGLLRTLPENALLNRLVARVGEVGRVIEAGAIREAGPALFGVSRARSSDGF